MSWRVDCDRTIWLEIPAVGPEQADAAHGWRDEAVAAAVAYFATSYTLGEQYSDLLRARLDFYLERAYDYEQRELGALFVYLPDPVVAPGMVVVNVERAQATDPDYLLDVTGARGQVTIGAAIVDHVSRDRLGDGIRVLRYQHDDQLGVIATLTYAWRVGEVDVIVFTQTNDVAQLERMRPDLDRFTATISVGLDGS